MKRLLALFATLLPATFPQAQPANCPGFENCVYTPLQQTEFAGQMVPVTYDDYFGLSRRIETWVRVPNVRTGRFPVVIWAHGGAEGRTAGIPGILQAPSDLSAGAGYLTISPAFRPRTPEEREPLCEFFEAPPEMCAQFETSSWDRPFDIRAIIAMLHRENDREASPLYQRIDLEKIVVGGHSAGSSGTLSVAGAWRQFGSKRIGGSDTFEDPAPIAFIALSPSASGYSYMFDTSFRDEEHSWKYVARPVLFVTGAGDGHEQQPHGRRIGYDYSPGYNNKFLAWFDDTTFSHGNYGEEPCEVPGEQRRCAAFTAAWSSVILSYLDAFVHQRPAAIEYMNKGYATRIPRGLFEIEWTSK